MLCAVDVGGWLKELGYDLDSLIPAVSYSGLVGRQCAYVSDDVSCGVRVTSAFSCAYDGNMARFSLLSIVSASLVTSADDASLRAAGVAGTPYVFGAGVLLSVDDHGDDEHRVTVTVQGSAAVSDALATLATSLLNGSTLVGPRLIGSHGRDVLHFVRDDVDDVVDDVRRVELRADARLNVTIHRVHDSPGTHSSLRYVDVRLRAVHATLSVRCGATRGAERARLRHRAWQRAVDAAWNVERDLVRAGRLTVNSWTRTQADQLVRTGRVDGYTGVYLRDMNQQLPRLVDCPSNIRFIPVT